MPCAGSDLSYSTALDQPPYDGQVGAIHRDWMGVRVQEIIFPRSWYAAEAPEESKEVIAKRQQVETAALQRVFGPRWSGLKPEHLKLANTLLHELAPRRLGRSSEEVAVRLLVGGPPPLGPNNPAHKHNRQQSSVVFWATGSAGPGPGRGLYGSRHGCLMVRAGYATPSTPMEERKKRLPQFTDDLAEVADMLGLRVSAYHHDYRWPLSVEDICSLARLAFGVETLLMARVLVRPDDLYLRQWARYFVACNGHPWNNQGTGRYLDTGGAQAEELFLRLRRLGLAQRHLARVLSVDPSLVTKLKHGERRWSSTLLKQAATFIAAAERHVVASVMGHW